MSKLINFSKANSILHHFLSNIRDVNKQKDKFIFRHYLKQISCIIGYEISKSLSYVEEEITTPICKTSTKKLVDDLVIAAVLRAAMPMVDGMLDVFIDAETAFLGEARENNESGLYINHSYTALPMVENKIIVIPDPLLATGKSLSKAIEVMSEKYPKRVIVCCAIAAPEGIEYIQSRHNVDIYCGAIDLKLDENKYIVPGLGDAGDLAFGVKQ